jgi:serine protease AprX
MSIKLLVHLTGGEEPEAIGESGVEVLARYPDMVLVRGTDEQVARLRESGVEATPLPEQPVQVAGNSFRFADAVAAQERVSLRPAERRTAYYLVKLVGPPAAEWLQELRNRDVRIHDSLPDFTLLVGMMPGRLPQLRALAWVEDVTPYRPAMKLSPRLRGEHRRSLGASELATPAADGGGGAGEGQLVEIAVFPGEVAEAVAARIRQAGGTVLSVTDRSLVASVDTSALTELAEAQDVQAILPYELPELHNDKAAQIIQVPPSNSFGAMVLKGRDQIVAVADSGLDTGDPATVHADVRGRVAGLVSWPVRPELALLLKTPGSDDGPGDEVDGHGTHVTGSVLGDGKSAVDAGQAPVPAGVAPEARLYFQAVNQTVQWKTIPELEAAGLRISGPWPPAAHGMYGLPIDISRLFQQAYDAGARIHTNSWGSSSAGAYTADARSVDDFMWRHPDMLILVSAGNEGADRDADGVIDPDSIASPGSAKNCVTVGASENNRPPGSDPPPGLDRHWNTLKTGSGALVFPALGAAGHVSDNIDGMAAFSSRGPADGGRVKPDVVAPGTNVLSMLSSVIPGTQGVQWGRLPEGHPLRPFYCWAGGTSMSTPLVAGAAALVRQRLVETPGAVFAGGSPSAALIKAFLVNGAQAMPGQFPGEIPEGTNNVNGFGRVNLVETITPQPFGSMWFLGEPDDAVATGQTRLYRLERVFADWPLRVVLAWTDAPSQVGIGSLVNQLYLQVVTPDGTVLDGDTTAYPIATNNVQRIVIPTPQAGDYTIRVHGILVIMDSTGAALPVPIRQNYAITVNNCNNLVRI